MARSDTGLPPELLNLFRDEARELLDELVVALDGLARQPPPEEVAELRQGMARLLHSIKGSAAAVQQDVLSRVAHATESALFANSTATIVPPSLAALLAEVAAWFHDAVAQGEVDAGEILRTLEGFEAPDRPEADATELGPPSSGATPPISSATTRRGPRDAIVGADSVRVPTAVLDELRPAISTMVAAQTTNRRRARRLRELAERLDSVTRQATAAGMSATLLEELAQVSRSLRPEGRDLDDTVRHHSRAMTDLERRLTRLRLVPFSTLEDTLRHALRDASEQTGKRASLVIDGGTVELDRVILERLKVSLVHLVRNAVDHGIERPDARREAGKAEAGRVALTVVSRGELVEIHLEDDGAGIDPEVIRHAAAERGLMDADRAARLETQELFGLLTSSGFSTRRSVTALSGRGVGLDVVQRGVAELGGTLVITSELGSGTRMVLSVPVSTLTTRVLVVRVDEQTVALPLGGIDATARATADAFHRIENEVHVTLEGASLPVHRLAGTAADDGRDHVVVSMTTSARRVALVVDEVLGEEQVVVRALGPPLGRLPGVLGSAIGGDGEVVVVLNPSEVLGLHGVLAPEPGAAATERPAPRVLVVDDSITTRTLERHILERQGYEVVVASDGIEAIAALRAQACDVVVSDVEMPNLDGIGLVRALRDDPRTAELPVILVTSLGSDEDRRRGIAAGANVYVAKSEFDQGALVDAIERLLRGEGLP